MALGSKLDYLTGGGAQLLNVGAIGSLFFDSQDLIYFLSGGADGLVGVSFLRLVKLSLVNVPIFEVMLYLAVFFDLVDYHSGNNFLQIEFIIREFNQNLIIITFYGIE